MRGGGFLILLGLIITLWSGTAWWSWTAASHWPTVAGTLLSADLQTKQHTGVEKRDNSITYAPDVRYRYVVDGREYLGARYALSNVSTSNLSGELAKVNALRQQQAKRGAIDVHYDPRKPGESALDVRVSPMAFLGFNFGLALLTLGLATAFPGSGASTYAKLTTGAGLAVLTLGLPYSLFGWSVNAFLMIAWAVCLTVPFTSIGAPKSFRSGRRLR